MRLVVTGGAGFIGSAFIRYVLRETSDVRIVNLDALTYAGNLASLASVADDPRYEFVHGDIGDAPLVDEVVAGADAVVHFAAESHVDRSIDGPAVFLHTNVSGSGVVFDATRRHGTERVLYISTDEVYGSIDPPARCTEEAPFRPNSPYAASKAAADLLARSYRVTYDHPIMITRTSNTLGPHHHPEKLIPRFVTSLLDGGTVPLYGDGGNVREWTFVDDNVAAQWLVLTDGEPGGVYNIGTGNEVSNRQLTTMLLERFGLTGPDAEARIRYVADRPGHDRRYAIDSSRIRELGWVPRWDLEAALDATIDWYRANEDWWQPLVDADGEPRRDR